MKERQLINVGKRILLFLLLFSVIFTGISPYQALAANEDDQAGASSEETSRVYAGDGYRIRYQLKNRWSTGFTAGITVTNTSDVQIEDWRLKADPVNRQLSLWNARTESMTDNTIVIKNAGYNADIAPGEEVSFGFTGAEAFRGFPNDIRLISEKKSLGGESFEASYALVSDWGHGFKGEITLKNISDKTIEDWCVGFDFGREIVNIWNARIVSHDGDHYVIKNAGYDQDIAKGASVTFGFTGRGGYRGDEPSGYCLTHYGAEGAGDRITVHFEPVFGDVSDMPADISIKAGGTVEEPEETPRSDNGIFLGWFTDREGEDCFDFETEKPEKDITLYAGWYDLDDETDTDGDGLTDQTEDLLLTDPAKKDTDSDGVDDYTEINLTMTDPLLPDTDGDGISDGESDADSDGLTNEEKIREKTGIVNPDTDDDSLEDGEEVKKYGTDSLKADTDGDGADDGTEIRYGFDPLVRNDSFDATVEAEGKVRARAELVVTGEQLGTLSVEKDDNQTLFPSDMPGYIGEAFDFNVDGTFDKARISFEFDRSLTSDPQFDPVIYYYNEDKQELCELETLVKGIQPALQ